MKPDQIKLLKEKAKEKLGGKFQKNDIDTSGLTREEIENAFHDLQVYKIELEIQNEELISAQSMLMELSEKYQFLYNTAPVGYLSVSMDGLIMEGNQTFADMVGVSPVQLQGKSIRNWIPQEYSFVYYDHRKRLIDTRQPQIFSLRLRRKNKTFIPVQVSLKLDDELNPSQILMIIFDETDVKNLEDAHKNLVENSAQGMWLFREEQLIFTNSRACEILGCSAGEFMGFQARDFLSMIDRRSWSDFLQYFEYNENDDFPETPVIIKFNYKKRGIWLEIYASPSNYNGQPALQFTFVDVTDRITAAENLKQSERKFKLAAELASDSIYTVDAENRTVRIMGKGTDSQSNDFDIRIFSSENFLKMVADADREIVRKSQERLYSAGEKFDKIYNMNLPDGEKKVIHDRATVLEWNHEKPKTILGVTSDLTTMKQTEYKLQELNATKDKFFSIIAHDLKNPFNSILGFSDILLDDYEHLTDADRLEMISKLSHSAESAFKLLDNLLKWSRIQINGLEQNPADIYLMKSLDETMKLLMSASEQKNIRVQVSIPEDLRAHVDPDILNSIVRNLITNAIKFTSTGGTVEVSASPVAGEMVKICVKDSGTGISQRDVEKLFTAGSKTGKRGTEGERGTGLGLILCREFVEMSGGTISVNSQLGRGSEFCFTLPSGKTIK